MLKSSSRLFVLACLSGALALPACMGLRTPLEGAGSRADGGPALGPDVPGAIPEVGTFDVAVARREAGPEARPTDATPDLRKLDAAPDVARGDGGADLPPRDANPDRGSADASSDLGRPDVPPTIRRLADCASGQLIILALGEDDTLYRFEPSTWQLRSIVQVGCGRSGLNSLTTFPDGHVYISNQSGQLCDLDLVSLDISLTPFNPSTIGSNITYGMALLPDASPNGQALYISANSRDAPDSGPGLQNDLWRVDTGTYKATRIGRVDQSASAIELTSGSRGELYGFAVSTPTSLLLTIDPKTAAAIDVTVVPAGYAASAFALVSWQEDFYLFIGGTNGIPVPGALLGSADVYRYHRGATDVTLEGSLGIAIIGAGVATCP
jgi:hypothetical protein